MGELHAVAGAGDTRPSLVGKQRPILAFIREYVAEHGYPPSVREIGAAVDLRSSGSVQRQLVLLEGKGYLRRGEEQGRPRTLRLVPESYGAATPDDAAVLLTDLTNAWHQLPAAAIGDVELAEFLQLRPAEREVFALEGGIPERLRPYWRWLHRSLGLSAGDRT